MKRRALLGAALSAAVAGCGWAQERDGPGGPPEQGSDGGSGDDGSDGSESGDGGSDDDVDEENLASSGGSEGLIEKDAKQLVLAPGDLEADGWEETNAQLSGTCSTFERAGEDRTFELESCATVYEDVETAKEEFQSDLDRSLKLMEEQLDVEPDIGDRAAAIRSGPREGDPGKSVLRLLFRDSNGVGRVDYIDTAGILALENEEVEKIQVDTAVEFGATMHDRWRD